MEEAALYTAYRLYLAIREVAERYALDALTIRCFDLIDQLGTTACLALALLNAEGIVAGREGDEQMALTMLVLSRLAGKPAWIANPVQVDYARNETTLAHCTASLNAGPYRLKTHYETGVGVGVD